MTKRLMGLAMVVLGLLWSSVGEADLNLWVVQASVQGQESTTIRLPTRGDTRFTIGHWTCNVSAERAVAGYLKRSVDCINSDEYTVQTWLACEHDRSTSHGGMSFGPARGASQFVHIVCIR